MDHEDYQPLQGEILLNFPPFYTLQPNLELRTRQLSEWASLVQENCRNHCEYFIQVTESITAKSPFNNETINRRLSLKDLSHLCQYMVEAGMAIKSSQPGPIEKYLIFPHSILYIADALYSWAKTSGLLGEVETLYHIRSTHLTTQSQPFYQLPFEHLFFIVKQLERDKKAVLVFTQGNNLSTAGVKFTIS